MKQMKKRAIAVLAAVLMVLTAGCGYKLVGGGYLDGSITTVAVQMFENDSSETRAGVSFTNELIREITQKTDTRVVDSSQTSKVISGTVRSITFSTLSRSSSENVVERQVTARVDVQLKGDDGEIIWSVNNFSAKESYNVSGRAVGDASSKREAVDTIAQRVAERLVSQMMSDF